jgi:phage tail protein X
MTQQTYTTKAGDVVDEIAFIVYDANPGLADLGPILPAGIVITLPDAPPVSATASQSLSLWD